LKIFIVEDDEFILSEIAEFLTKYQFTCQTVKNFNHVVEDVLESNSDLVLLDINLPSLDGFEICRRLREKSSVAIIMVTSRNTCMDELMSLKIGADDFVTKPYDLQVLLAHIQVVLKRSKNNLQGIVLSHNGLALKLGKYEMQYEGELVELSKNEAIILRVLMENAGVIVCREDLMKHVWEDGDFVDENTLNVNISRLRKKMESLGLSDYLKTKRNQGYII
jgi:DNA-binding response OmpR family regulator